MFYDLNAPLNFASRTELGYTHVMSFSASSKLFRQTFTLEDTHLPSSKADVIAVVPLTEKAFNAACLNLDIDIIQIDDRPSFQLKPALVAQAMKRGIFFEVCYGAAIRDSKARRIFLGNLKTLADVCRGRNIVISSGAECEIDLRRPADVQNIAIMCGLKQDAAKKALTDNCKAVIEHGAIRKRTFKGIVAEQKDVEEFIAF